MSVDLLIASLTPAERRAVALVGLMIRLHGGADGDGLFTGPKRYAVLADRLRLAAERARDVRGLFDLAARELRWGLSPMRYDAPLLSLLRPDATDAETLRALADRSQSIIMIARQMASAERRAASTDADAPTLELPELEDPLDVFDRIDIDAATTGAA